jgi:hypothetical protein
MDLPGMTYRGAPLDDVEILERLSPDHAQLLARRNGIVAFAGGLHLRGASRGPAWHSLRAAWEGPAALAARFAAILPADVPLGQLAGGDQLLLRGGEVHRYGLDEARLVATGLDLAAFLEAAQRDPIATLDLDALAAFQASGGWLQPGQLLAPDPDAPARWRAIAADARLADAARTT